MRCTAILLCASFAAAADATSVERVGFEVASPYAARDQIAARMLHGVQHQRVLAQAERTSRALVGQALDPKGAHWQLYLPDSCRDAPCGLLVWLSPWDEATPPRDWLAVLESERIAYVAAEDAGNSRDVLDRRVPLALLGLAGVQARAAIDPRRTYVGGFSGGGRVASRLAAGYPDLFAGGVFVATSDGLGTSDAPVPSRERLAALRQGRWWFAVGDEDPENAAITHDAFKHWRRLCALDSRLVRVTGWGHRTLDGRRLRQALGFMRDGAGVAAATQTSCEREALAAATAALAQGRRLLEAGDADAARRALLDAHRAWGGLIAPEFDALWDPRWTGG